MLEKTYTEKSFIFQNNRQTNRSCMAVALYTMALKVG